jgi:HD-like signal output (HDOD) protein/ActR/RegA family two-component response regulator
MPKQVLFVDDNPLLLQMYAMGLQSERDQWLVKTAEDAYQALKLLEEATFDVVVSDLRMPGMDGIELMAEVSRRSPRSSRIIVSGLDNHEEVVRGLNATHLFLAKPVNVKELKATLARVGGLEAFLKDEKLRKLLGQVKTLPSFPSVYARVMQELGAAEPSLERISTVIASDPGMTVKLLQIVNSAAFGLARHVTKVGEAVQFLGLGLVRSLVLSAHILSSFQQRQLKGFSAARLWEHGMKTAAIARMILELEQAEMTDIEEAYIAGMLHDLGKLILAENVPKEFCRALKLAAQDQILFYQAELELLGASHAAVGAYLLSLWGLPTSMVEAVAFHHTPGKCETSALGPLTAVHVANVLEHEFSHGKLSESLPQLDLSYLSRLGVLDRLDVWRTAAAELWVSKRRPA